ncbi:MAG: SpaH/EbpB family LPXTG-anchored major pilin, partial [bacterium]
GDTKLLVQVNGTSLRLGTDYTIDTFTTGKGGTFVVTFKQSYLDSLKSDVDIDVTYKVLVNEDAEIASANVNTATLKYGDNQTVVKDETSTYAYKFGLYKTAKIDGVEHTVLDGAKFKLYDAKTGGNEIPVVYDNGVYRPALTGETGVEIEVGTATISGLKNDTYYLEETEAPEGYNKLTERQEVKVKDANNVGSVVENVYQQDGGLEVVNKAGAVLPSTGGMGTTLIYIVGAMLIAFSGILLLNRRHMNDE